MSKQIYIVNMDKFIQVKQGSNILYLPKEAYHQLVQDYKDMHEALMKVCGKRCDECPFDKSYIDTEGDKVFRCKIQRHFDPRENQLN